MGINDGYGFGNDTGGGGGDPNHENDPAGYWYDTGGSGRSGVGGGGSSGEVEPGSGIMWGRLFLVAFALAAVILAVIWLFF